MPPFVIARDAPSGAFLPEPWPLRVKTRGGFLFAGHGVDTELQVLYGPAGGDR